MKQPGHELALMCGAGVAGGGSTHYTGPQSCSSKFVLRDRRGRQKRLSQASDTQLLLAPPVLCAEVWHVMAGCARLCVKNLPDKREVLCASSSEASNGNIGGSCACRPFGPLTQGRASRSTCQ